MFLLELTAAQRGRQVRMLTEFGNSVPNDAISCYNTRWWWINEWIWSTDGMIVTAQNRNTWENSSQCLFVYHKSHWPGHGAGPPRGKGGGGRRKTNYINRKFCLQQSYTNISFSRSTPKYPQLCSLLSTRTDSWMSFDYVTRNNQVTWTQWC
jgi:hypothetical protein